MERNIGLRFIVASKEDNHIFKILKLHWNILDSTIQFKLIVMMKSPIDDLIYGDIFSKQWAL